MKWTPQQSSGVVLEGYYGMQNAGDDAFCVVGTELASRNWGVSDVALTGPPSTLPSLPIAARGLFPDSPRFKGHGRLAPLPTMLRYGRVVHMGGSTFHSMTARHRDEQKLAKLGLIDLSAIGVSIGPFKTPDEGQRVVEHLHHFSSVYVRDAASVERVNRIDASAPVEQGFDIAVLLPELEFLQPYLATGAEPNETGPILGVSVCSDASLRMADTETQETRETRLSTLFGTWQVRRISQLGSSCSTGTPNGEILR